MSEIVEVSAGLTGYLSHPKDEIKAGVIVIHEVWGLTDHIKSIADRLAAEGYLVLAPDLLAGSGVDVDKLSGLQEGLFDPARRNQVQPKLRQLMTPLNNPEFSKRTVVRLKDCFKYLYDRPETNKSVAVVGFCFGGTYSYSLAVNEPRLKMAVPFYGHSNFSVDELKQINCPIRAFYGQNDEGLREQMTDLPAKMKQAGIDYEQKIYSDCGHAFFNDSNKFAYNKTAAGDAWTRVKTELTKL